LLRKTKNYEQALLAQKRAFALDPHSGDMHNNLANILGDMGELEQSCSLRLELIAKAPDSPNQIALAGRSMRHRG
jgi:tetratricopeptide (TPR) repeat protein